METCTIIPSLFIFLCIIKTSRGYSCNTTSCPRSLNSSVYTTEVSVHSPFRLNPIQSKSCGYEGFELHCDDTLGTLIQFSNSVVLHVDEINYNRNLLILSDPYDHFLTQKLLSFNLADTPFYPANGTLFYSDKFWLYNCSIVDSYDDHLYNRIECLSGSGYTVISTKLDTAGVPNSNSCKFLKILTVSTLGRGSSYHSSRLCTLSSIALSWSGVPGHREAPPAYSREPAKSYYSLPEGVLAPLAGAVIPIVTLLLCYCRFCRKARATTSTMNNQSIALPALATTSTVTGLDQVTIDSYPVIVVGASGRLIKPDDTTCPICLSDYCPRDILKILPECIHRFHADCIDEWLRAKGVCPICRTSTPYISSNH